MFIYFRKYYYKGLLNDNKVQGTIQEFNNIHWAREIFRMSGVSTLIRPTGPVPD